MDSVIVILWTAAKEKEAKAIISHLLEKKWIACANIIPQVHSLYTWKGRIEESKEVCIFLKTVASRFDLVARYIEEHSSYDVPEILQIPVQKGLNSYLDWVRQNTQM